MTEAPLGVVVAQITTTSLAGMEDAAEEEEGVGQEFEEGVAEQADIDATEAEVGEEENAGEEVEGEAAEQGDAEPTEAEAEEEQGAGEEDEEEGVQPNNTVAQVAEAGRNVVKEVVEQVDKVATLQDVAANSTADDIIAPRVVGQVELRHNNSAEAEQVSQQREWRNQPYVKGEVAAHSSEQQQDFSDDFTTATSLYEAASTQLMTALKAAGLD